MVRSLTLAVTALALSSVAASAQAIYVAPGYGYGYVAPPAVMAPVGPLYDYVPGYAGYGYGGASYYIDVPGYYRGYNWAWGDW